MLMRNSVPDSAPLPCARRAGGGRRARLRRAPVTSTCDADCHWLACGRVIESTFEPTPGSQNPAHASMSLRRFSSASPRLYARSVASPDTCASAASASSPRLPPAKIAARLGISEPKLNRFMRRVHAAREMPRPEPARPHQLRHQAPSSSADRLIARLFGE
jgi:hypothetical protein